jgi:hypothetical protein
MRETERYFLTRFAPAAAAAYDRGVYWGEPGNRLRGPKADDPLNLIRVVPA